MIDTAIMDYGDYDVMLPPSTYCAGGEIRYIFAVPKDNMVGTNELHNAITLLEFKDDDELDQHIVKRDFMEMVTGPFEFRFLPNWSDREIAYSQSRGFLLVDIAARSVEMHTVISGLDGVVERLQVLDGSRHVFVLEVDLPTAGLGNQKKLLRVVRLERGSLTVLAEHPAGIRARGYSEPWFVYQERVFVYNDSTTRLEVYDEKFEPANHPLADAFNRNSKSFRRLQEIVIHPTMPFALVTEMGKEPDVSEAASLPPSAEVAALTRLYEEVSRTTLFLFRWTHEDEEQRMLPLLSGAGSIWGSYNPKNNYSDFEFSPDGKWCVFRDYTGNGRNTVFVAVPVSEKNSVHLGKPVKLGNAMRPDAIEPTGTAWTTHPTAFVMCDGLVIYRWNLDRYDVLSSRKTKMPPDALDPFVGAGE